MNSQIVSILANTIDLFFRALSFLIIIRILMSWFAPRSRGQIAFFVLSATEPILRFFRRLPLRIGMLDLSPLVAIIAIDLARTFLLRLLFVIF
ncbi:MAG: YggT family protein [Candidatus Peribacteraceae bacterium]|nr:YggT family protein [Candidatus Peribacteraceae bacterium]